MNKQKKEHWRTGAFTCCDNSCSITRQSWRVDGGNLDCQKACWKTEKVRTIRDICGENIDVFLFRVAFKL